MLLRRADGKSEPAQGLDSPSVPDVGRGTGMPLTTRLAIAMILLVAIAVTAVGWLSYINLERVILPRVLDRIETHSRLLALDLQSYVRGARADVVPFRQRAAANGMVRAHFNGGIDPVDRLSEAVWRERLLTRLAADVGAKPAYAQFRVIGIEDGGREVLRVDRSGPNGSVRVVPDAELQRKGDRPYFKETVKLTDGQAYVSPVELNQENGAVDTPYVPTLRVASPIFAPDGKLFGIAIINLDMRPAFDRIRASVRRKGEHVYIVDAQGDYLVHPDPAREFGSQLGRPTGWQKDFPDFASSVGAATELTKAIPDAAGAPSGMAIAPAILAGQQWIGIIEVVPNAIFMAPAVAIERSTIEVGLVAVLGAAILAVMVARSLTGPILHLTAAVEGGGRPGTPAIPVDAPGETGVLARAFARAISEINNKTDALERESRQHQLTERARDHFAARDRLYSAVVESSDDAVITKSLDGIITGWNPAAERLFGYSAQEAIGQSINLIVPADRRPEVRTLLRRIGNGERIDHHETVRLRKDGRDVHVSLSLSPIKSATGEISGASKIARDMTESMLAQENLRESEQLARGIIETSLDAFVQMNETGTITDWNSQAEKLFGWSHNEAIGQKLAALIVPERHRAAHWAGLEHFLRTGEAAILGRRIEIDALRRDNTEIKVELSITLLKRRDDVVFNAFVRDLTDKIAAEDRIRQSEKMETIGQLTGGIAHDFNNILTVITGTIEILADAVKSEPQLAAIAKLIDEAAVRGADLTQHLLAFARRQPLQPCEIDVNALIMDTAKLLRPTLGEHIEIESVFRDESCFAVVDPNQLVTAIINLAVNSRDAMPDGGKLIIETTAAFLDEAYASQFSDVHPGRYALIAVSDTGKGIPAAIIDKVFEPFFTSKGPGKGTGLGLSMVYGFIKQSVGHIRIYSEEGHGTTIKMYLPPGTGAALAAESEVAAVEIEGGHETILVVEDDRLVRDYVLKQLHGLGYSTLEAANAAAALELADAPFDLLFTDVIMPGAMNGRQLADAMTEMRPGLKVLSGYTENAIIHHGRLDAGVLLLAKPYRKSDLARMIRKALES
jgi:PAS domain S-box-containing protein